MGKRATGVGKNKTSHSKKTQKRLAIKREMLVKKAARTSAKAKVGNAKKQVKK